jgi:hypothetical protein
MTVRRRYVPIDKHGFRVPISEWTKKDHVTFDGALPDGKTSLDPEGTNSSYGQPDSLLKKQEFAVGGLKNNYFPNDPAEAADDDLDELPDEVVEALLDHAKERGCSEEMLEKLHMRLRGSQAEDADQPPDNVSGGQPLRGGSMTPFKSRQTVNAEQKAMDSRVGSFQRRWPEAARISGNGFTSKRDPVPPSLALDVKKRGDTKSFAERHPNAARIGQCY